MTGQVSSPFAVRVAERRQRHPPAEVSGEPEGDEGVRRRGHAEKRTSHEAQHVDAERQVIHGDALVRRVDELRREPVSIVLIGKNP